LGEFTASEGTDLSYYGEDMASDIESESMPNFHEHEEEDEIFDHLMRANTVDEDGHSDLEDDSVPIQHSKDKVKPRPPISAPAPQLRKENAVPNLNRLKPKSHNAARHPLPFGNTQNAMEDGPISATDGNEFYASKAAPRVRASEQNAQTCPVCFKSLVLDNQEFNAHVDFCLSREAIREAQLEAVGSGVKEMGQRQSMWLSRQETRVKKEREQNSDLGTKRRT
jgi:DNA polymerase kappa